MTHTQVKADLARYNIACTYRPHLNEFRVSFRDDHIGDSAYFTDDLTDAHQTGLAMALNRYDTL